MKTSPKICGRNKKIIKVRAEFNETGNRKTTGKISKIKSWLVENKSIKMINLY